MLCSPGDPRLPFTQSEDIIGVVVKPGEVVLIANAKRYAASQTSFSPS